MDSSNPMVTQMVLVKLNASDNKTKNNESGQENGVDGVEVSF